MIKLGVIGYSEGNGHPYSWSAIFNGYDAANMRHCEFPEILSYLEKQRWPEDRLRSARVTHVWTQNRELSQQIAGAAAIDNIVESLEEMIGKIDAVLLARDDAETHLALAKPFLDAGLPIYIDKPIAYSIQELERIYDLEQFPGQIFTCSAVRYAREFQLRSDEIASLGPLRHFVATINKDWGKYAIHVIEPMLQLAGDQGRLISSERWRNGDRVVANFLWESSLTATIMTLGHSASPLALRVIGQRDYRDLCFVDTFSAFKAALKDFVDGILAKDVRTDQSFIRRSIELVERGL
jgi:predicted dehydrogenase